MDAALLERAFDLFRSNQRARRIVNGDIFCDVIDATQARPNRILSTFTDRDDRADFFELCT